MERETELEITQGMMNGGFPWGTCHRHGVEFLENAGTFEFHELNVRYEIRYLGFGYFLATPEGMEESAGTGAEHEEQVVRPFVFRNTGWNNEHNQGILAL